MVEQLRKDVDLQEEGVKSSSANDLHTPEMAELLELSQVKQEYIEEAEAAGLELVGFKGSKSSILMLSRKTGMLIFETDPYNDPSAIWLRVNFNSQDPDQGDAETGCIALHNRGEIKRWLAAIIQRSETRKKQR